MLVLTFSKFPPFQNYYVDLLIELFGLYYTPQRVCTQVYKTYKAEETLFPIIEQMLNVRLDKNRKIYLSDNAYTYIQPDFYSESELIIGEIFAHIGKPKKAQDNKIANDILKMLLLEKVTGKQYRKIIAVCDESEMKKLKGLSALAESIRQFNIEVLYVKIDASLKDKLLNAQCRQKMVNA